jgi:hypothetical protein
MVVVRAVDANGNVVAGYTGTVRFTSTSAGATLPADYKFTAADAGTHTFSVALNTAGTASITVTDTTTGITGSQTGIQVTSGAASKATNLVYVSGNNQQGSTQTTGGTGSGSAGGVTWTKQATNETYPGVSGYLQIFFDPFTKQTVYYGVRPGSGSIYASDIYFYSSASKAFTHLGGTGQMTGGCTLDTDTQPGERHPYWQMAMDTKRNVMWMASGVNQSCDSNPAGPNGSPRQDMYYLQMNANPAQSVWRRVAPAHPLKRISAALAYDSDNDVLLMFGENAGNAHSVYCPTINPATGAPSGVLTAAQTAAGCAAPDDWSEVRLNNGSVDTNGTAVTLVSGIQFTAFTGGDYVDIGGEFFQVASVTDGTHMTLTSSAGTRTGRPYFVMPPGVSQPGLVYDTATKKMIMFGGATQSQSTFYNQTWAYDVAARAWTHKARSTTAPPMEASGGKTLPQPEMTYNPVNKKVYYHQVSGTGGPADWQYDPVADTWTRLTSTGTGPTRDSAISFDTSCNCLITLSNVSGTGTAPEIWHGTLTPAASPAPVEETVTVGLPLSEPFVVKTTDGSGNPVSGTPVTFTVTAGGGKLTGNVVQNVVNTDAQGLASTILTFGLDGTNMVTASSGTLAGSPVTFVATPPGTPATNRCDLNGDAVVNATDVQLAYNQILGPTACTTADLNGDGVCNIIDAQKVINASLGGKCQ